MKRVASLILTATCFFVASPALSAEQLTRTNLMQWRDDSGVVHPITSPAQWSALREQVLTAMQEVMGELPGPERRVALDLQIEEEVDCGAYLRRFITYQSEPGSRVPAWLLIPKKVLGSSEKTHGILALHQTHPAGHKVVVGLGDSPDDEYGVELAERGYVCIAPAYPLLADYAPDLAQLGYSSGTMKAIWDNMRALDVLESLGFVHPGRFASIGHSLGGHNGIFTAAFDPRIKAVVSSCGLDSFRDYMGGDIRGWTSQRYMPRLLDYPSPPFDFHEVIAAIAPRACFISAPMGDSNFRWWSARDVGRAARPVFELLGAEDALLVTHPEAGHLFPPEVRRQAFGFIERHLSSR